MLVPFIATPLAGKAKDWMCRNDKPVTISDETKNNYNPDKKLDVSTTDVKEVKENKPQIAHSNKLVDSYVQTHPQK